jgi:hypothetical protein
MPFNLVAVLAVGIANMVLGFLWYGPMLFANRWMKESKLTMEDIGNGPGIGYLLTFLASLVMGAATSFLVGALNITDPLQGLALGLILGIGYVGTSFLSTYVFGQKSWTLYFIDAGYQVTAITIAGLLATLIR